MRANYIASRSDLKRASMDAAKEELNRQKQEICPACEQYIGQQVTAVLLKVLNVRYGFGKERLRQIITDTENLFELCAIDGKRFNAIQAVEWLKSIGIDLEKGSEQ